MICKKCLKKIDDGSIYCIYCGARQSSSLENNKTNLASNNAKDKNEQSYKLRSDITNNLDNNAEYTKEVKNEKKKDLYKGIFIMIAICVMIIAVILISNDKNDSSDNLNNNYTNIQFNQNDVRNVVNEYIQRNMGNSIDYVTHLYAEEVSFYNSGIVNKNFIIEDKRKYFAKWPVRNIILTNIIIIPQNNEWTVRIKYHFTVENKKRKISGDASGELIYKDINNSLLIISEKGEISN